jgi:hypothetical protein
MPRRRGHAFNGTAETYGHDTLVSIPAKPSQRNPMASTASACARVDAVVQITQPG